SRRRHTRCYRDWSSDVCSSDLGPLEEVRTQWERVLAEAREPAAARRGCDDQGDLVIRLRLKYLARVGEVQVKGISKGSQPFLLRSEERRVGKGCSARWRP